MTTNLTTGGKEQSAALLSAKTQPCPARQRVPNWSHSEVMALITCKHQEYTAQKAIVDPRARMIPAAQKWLKISEQLHDITKSKVPRNSKMCKDKWNGIYGDFKKISDYHKGTGHYTAFWDLSMEEKDKLQLPRQFHNEFYDAVEAFQGERSLCNSTVHVLDSQAEASAPVQSANSPVTCDFDSENIINLTDTPAFSPLPALHQPHLAMGVPGPGNTLVKRKRKSGFLPVIEATDKSSRVLVEAMDRLNATQQDLEKTRVKLQRKSTKAHLDYVKERDKKSLKMTKNMVNVLSNLSTAMCHAFIKDPALIRAPINFLQSSSEGGPPAIHCLSTSDEEKE